MEGWKEYIDVLVQAPMAVILIYFIHISNKKYHETLSGYQKLLEKLIDKIK